jgi:uncharacterized SAM-binding protein YcdF (DUF218 family)
MHRICVFQPAAMTPKPYRPDPQRFKAPVDAAAFRGAAAGLGRVVGMALSLVALALLLTALALASFATVYGSFAHPPPAPYLNPTNAAPIAVVLAAGVRDGALDRRSGARTETGVRLYLEGRVGRLHSTGGSRGPTPAAALMRDYAIARGVPPEAISVETESRTTIENAVLTTEALGRLPRGAVLVTDAAHLPRAWASFVWAGQRGLALVPAHQPPAETRAHRASFIGRETLAVWLTAGRMAAVSALLRLGAEPEDTAPLLDRLPIGWRLPT